jgi:hypothetical protein
MGKQPVQSEQIISEQTLQLHDWISVSCNSCSATVDLRRVQIGLTWFGTYAVIRMEIDLCQW